MQEYWREQSSLHINIKEMKAAINTVKSLGKSNETICLNVDNQVIFYYLQKRGGKKNPFNQLLQPFYRWLMENNINLQVRWVPSEECLADPLSRWVQDKGDYSLDPALFNWVKIIFKNHIKLTTDLFASPGNKKLEKFVSRWPHWEASAVDALQCPLDNLGGVICQPPLVSNSKIPLSVETVSNDKNSDDCTLLGFHCVVAPINKDENSRDPLHKKILTRGKKATSALAPSLPSVCRQILEGREIEDKSIGDFLAKNPSLRRYDSAFKILWAVLEKRRINPPEATADQLADGIIEIFQISPAQARNAYSACQLLPGVGGGSQVPPPFTSV